MATHDSFHVVHETKTTASSTGTLATLICWGVFELTPGFNVAVTCLYGAGFASAAGGSVGDACASSADNTATGCAS